MIWTILVILAVMATKAVTALRLKDLRSTLEGIQPKLAELRRQVREAEDEVNDLKAREAATKAKVGYLRGVVQYLENTVKGPAIDGAAADERELVLQAADDTD